MGPSGWCTREPEKGRNVPRVFVKFDQAGCKSVIPRLTTPRNLYRSLGVFSVSVGVTAISPARMLQRRWPSSRH
jgi:hypothetical protein